MSFKLLLRSYHSTGKLHRTVPDMSMISRQSKTQSRPVILTIIADVKLPRMLPSSLSFYPVPILNGEKSDTPWVAEFQA
jgi:hypothetical protein